MAGENDVIIKMIEANIKATYALVEELKRMQKIQENQIAIFEKTSNELMAVVNGLKKVASRNG